MAGSATREKWAHLVGMDAQAAKDEILKDSGSIQVAIVRKGSIVTMDFQPNRVRIFVDEHNKVHKAPRAG